MIFANVKIVQDHIRSLMNGVIGIVATIVIKKLRMTFIIMMNLILMVNSKSRCKLEGEMTEI